jgi:hypothetical protein
MTDMAKRVLNRRQLRDDAGAAARTEPTAAPATEPAADGAPVKKKAAPRKKAAAGPRPKRVAKKKDPVRMRARWAVFDGGMKQIAVFDYSNRGAADQKLADMNAKKGGAYFLQLVKEPMPAPPPPVAAPPA